MKSQFRYLFGRTFPFLCAAFVVAPTTVDAGPPAAAEVSYQGQLKRDGAPANGVFDFQFTLRQADGVTLVDRTCAFDVPVVNGLFQAELEFAASAFDGSPRLLQLGVRNAGSGFNDCSPNTIGFLFDLLTPLQPISAAPYALRAFSAPTGSSLNASDGSPVNALVVDNVGRVGIGTTTPAEELTVAGDVSLSISGLFKGVSGALGFLSNLGDNTPGVRIESATDIEIHIDTDNNSQTFLPNTLRIYGNGETRQTDAPILLVSDDGNVNIGGTSFSPDHRLEVGGATNDFFRPGDPLTEIQIFHYLQEDVAPPGFVGATAALVFRTLMDNPSPTPRTDTEASIRVEANQNDSQVMRLIAESTNTDITLETSAGEAMRIDTGLNVGVGTTAPARRLHVSNGSSAGTSQANADLVVEDNSSCYVNIMAPDASEHGVSFGSPAGSVHGGVYYTNSLGLDFRTGNNASRMTINSAGNVGMGVGVSGGSIDARLHVAGGSASARPLKVDRTGSDGELIAFARDDSIVGSITVTSGAVSYNAFTGSHYAWSAANIAAGALVSMTGDNRRFGDRSDAEVVYGVTTTARANDPSCLGVHFGPMESTKASGPENPLLVAAVGNGELCVVDRGAGDIEPGDYLISSDVPGCAMKDDPARFPIGHIVAKAADRIVWSGQTVGEQGVRRARISVLFTAFVRGRQSDLILEKDRRIAELEARLSRVEQMMPRTEAQPSEGP